MHAPYECTEYTLHALHCMFVMLKYGTIDSLMWTSKAKVCKHLQELYLCSDQHKNLIRCQYIVWTVHFRVISRLYFTFAWHYKGSVFWMKLSRANLYYPARMPYARGSQPVGLDLKMGYWTIYNDLRTFSRKHFCQFLSIITLQKTTWFCTKNNATFLSECTAFCVYLYLILIQQ